MTSFSEVRDGLCIDWDVPIAMDDGLVLRADVFRPPQGRLVPALLSYGPYGKGLAFQDGYPTAWEQMVRDHPDVARGTSNRYQNWEVADPEKWVPDGYACVRVDSRGCGRSPGQIDHHSPRETRDLYDCIEWAAAQPWCNGRVGLAGISYYATNQWRVAALQPPHLRAICVWEGFADRYRDSVRHGGILCSFTGNWQEMQVRSVQHGRGEQGPRNPTTGDLVCGDVTLSEEELAGNRRNMWGELLERPLDGPYYRERSADWSRIIVPLLSCANWGGQGLHTRGNFEGFMRAASAQKWLEVHGGAHWALFYTDYGVALQKRFFGYFLKGEPGWEQQPRVQLQVRHVDRFEQRHDGTWPLARTQWTPFYLDLAQAALVEEPPTRPAELGYAADGEGITFSTRPLPSAMEITGPSVAKLFVSSATGDADLFLVLRVFAPDGTEVTFQGALDPHTPIGQGWLRASHRKLDSGLSTPWRPYHTHEEVQPLRPGEIAELDIEIWPTSIVIPPGHRLAVTVRGQDYECSGEPARLSNMRHPMRGCGPFTHETPSDRPPEVFGSQVMLHSRPGQPLRLLLPVIPASK